MINRSYTEIIECVQSDMEHFDNSIKKVIEKYDNALTKDLELFLTQGSKRLRIALIFLVTRALGSEVSEKQMSLASGIELIHNASLLHDDVIDNAKMRRKEKSFNSVHNNTVSVIGGDFLLSLAMEKFMELKDQRILDMFLKTIKTLCEGEIHQYFHKKCISTIDEYIDKSYQKTGILYELAVNSAVILANNSVNLKEFIKNFGIAFQIKDDYNNIYTAKKSTDIEEGVYNAPVIYAAKDYKRIKKYNSQKILKIAKKKKYEQMTKNLLQKYIDKAIENLNVLKDSEYKNALIDLCKFLEVNDKKKNNNYLKDIFSKENIKKKIRAYFTKENLKNELKELYETVIFVIVALILVREFVFDPRVIPSASMHPTLIEGDRLIIERYSRFFTSPKRGDIIVFYPPHEYVNQKQDLWSIFKRMTGFFCDDIAYIKRVIGEPGDSVEIRKENDETYSVYVNGEKLDEPYIQSSYDYPPCDKEMKCNVILGPDEFFALGDNRGNSKDSRYWGFVDKKRIIGTAKLRFWPLNRLHYFSSIKY